MAEYTKIYPALDPTAPLDEGAFKKSRASAFFNKICEIELEITKKLKKTKRKTLHLAAMASTAGAIYMITGDSATATSFTIVGLPVGASLGVVAAITSTDASISLGFHTKYDKRTKAYLKMLDLPHTAKASYEFAFSASLSQGILHDEFARLQKIFYDLLRI